MTHISADMKSFISLCPPFFVDMQHCFAFNLKKVWGVILAMVAKSNMDCGE